MGHIEPKRPGLSRRNFIVATLTAAGGLSIGVSLPSRVSAATADAPPWNSESFPGMSS